MTSQVVVFAALVLGFVAGSRLLRRFDVTAPIVFVVAGVLIAAVSPEPSGEVQAALRAVAEVTLALVLFHDAAQVRPRQIDAELGLVVRLLLVGLPLTVLVGLLGAWLLFPEMPVVVALLLAAALAPTDAGLGAATVLNPVVPVRVRRLLNVESGLNDGLATPVVLFAIATIAGDEGLEPHASVGAAVGALVVGVAVGGVCGAGAGRLLGWSRRRDLSDARSRTLGVLVLPLLAYGLAELLGGNAFVAAFVAGTAFAGAARWAGEDEPVLDLTEEVAEPLGLAVWLAFGVIALPLAQDVDWRVVAFAVLSLTVCRTGPVAVSLIGTGLRAPTVLFVGWFGPRGLASVVFALLAVEGLEMDAALRTALATIALTVMLSVVLHGMTADPLAARYGGWVARTGPTVEVAGSAEPRTRGALLARPHQRPPRHV